MPFYKQLVYISHVTFMYIITIVPMLYIELKSNFGQWSHAHLSDSYSSFTPIYFHMNIWK